MRSTPSVLSAKMLAREFTSVGVMRWPRPWRGRKARRTPARVPTVMASLGSPKGVLTLDLFHVGERLHLVDAAAADDADADGAGHGDLQEAGIGGVRCDYTTGWAGCQIAGEGGGNHETHERHERSNRAEPQNTRNTRNDGGVAARPVGARLASPRCRLARRRATSVGAALVAARTLDTGGRISRRGAELRRGTRLVVSAGALRSRPGRGASLTRRRGQVRECDWVTPRGRPRDARLARVSQHPK